MGKIPKKFDYDVVELLNSVRDRPCLWDTQLESYKDRLEKKAAWEEIFVILDGSYEQLTPEAKRLTGGIIQNKWTNIRDTFVRSLRKGDKQKRKYLLYEHVKFLLPVISKYDSELDFEHDNEDFAETSFKQEESDSPEPTKPAKTRKKKKRARSETPEENYEPETSGNGLNYVEVTDDPRVMNEDEAFFASLLPTIVKYNEDERLKFRLDVLNVMKNIRNERQWNPRI